MPTTNEFKNSPLARTSPRKAMPLLIGTLVLISACMYLLVHAI